MRTIVLAALVLAAGMVVGTSVFAAGQGKQQKSCFEICSSRGGLETGRQVQACTSRCEINRGFGTTTGSK